MRRPDSVGAPAFVATRKGPFVINGFPGLYFCKIYRAYNTVLSINIMYGRLRALLEAIIMAIMRASMICGFGLALRKTIRSADHPKHHPKDHQRPSVCSV